MVEMEYSGIPDKAFIKVIRKRDIVKARPLNREEKKAGDRGGPDIILIGPTGDRRLITRRELLKNYTYINGKKINIRAWTSKKTYLIGRMDNTEAYALGIPSNWRLNLETKRQSRGGKDYLICLAGQDGVINRSEVGVIQSSLFRKMYHIPENEVITRNIGKGNKLFTGKSKGLNNNKDRIGIKKEVKYEQSSEHKNDPFKQLVDEMQSEGLNEQKKLNDSAIKKNTVERKKYTAKGRLMSNGMLVGFIIENSAGEVTEITKQDMIKLCKSKLVDNIVLGKKEANGVYYLRGNGIRIEMLEPYEV